VTNEFDAEADSPPPESDEGDDGRHPARPRPLARLPRLGTGGFAPRPPDRPLSSGLRERMPRLPSGVLRGGTPRSRPPAAEDRSAAEEASDTLAADVDRWVLALARLFGGLRVYADNNPRLQNDFDRALAALGRIFGSTPQLALEIEKGRFAFRGVPIRAGSSDDARALIRRLAGAGVDRFSIHPGLDRKELARFLQALASDALRGEGDDNALDGFPHIQFGDEPEAKPKLAEVPKPPKDAAAILAEHIASHPEALFELGAELGARRLPRDRGPDPLALARARTDLGPLEAEIQAYDRKKDARALAARAAELLFSSVAAGREALDSSASLALFLRLFDALFAAGEFSALAKYIEQARALSEDPDRKKSRRGTRLLEYIVDPPRLDRLIRTLNERREVAFEIEFSTLVDTLVPFAARHLLVQLDAFEYPEHAAWIAEMLARSVELDPKLIEEIAPSLSAESLVALLGIGLRQPSAVSASVVVDALEHGDPRVRRAAVEVLAVFPRGDADLWLEAMAQDPDPSVRSASSRIREDRPRSGGDQGAAGASVLDAPTLGPPVGERDLSKALAQDAGVQVAFDDRAITQVTGRMSAEEQAEARSGNPFADADDVHTVPAREALKDDVTVAEPKGRSPERRGSTKRVRRRKK
jgi:hypothetical protein